jgi:hypothetical protein
VLDLRDWGRVAQLVEQCPFKAWVAGSNPAALTKISKHLADLLYSHGHPIAVASALLTITLNTICAKKSRCEYHSAILLLCF